MLKPNHPSQPDTATHPDKAENAKSALEAGLPDPGDFPGRDVVLWDGQCVFCRRSVGALHALDWTGALTFMSLHDTRTPKWFAHLSYDQLMDQMWVVSERGKQFGGADAIRYLSRRMPALWLAAPIMHLPLAMPLYRKLYHLIAQYRYRIAGRDCDGGTCELHRRD